MDDVRQEINVITQELRDVATILENDFVHVDAVAKPLPDSSPDVDQHVERTLQMLVFKQINVFNILQKVHTRQVKMNEQLNFIQKFIIELSQLDKNLTVAKSVEDVIEQDVIVDKTLCAEALQSNALQSETQSGGTTQRMMCLFCLCVFVLWYSIGFASAFAS